MSMPRRTGGSARYAAAFSGALASAALLLAPLPATADEPAWELARVRAAGPSQPAPAVAAADVADTDRVLVKPHEDAEGEHVRRALQTAGVRLVDRIDGLGVLVVEAPSGAADALRRLAVSPVVAYAEPDHAVQALRRVPNDPIYPHQWGLPQISAPAAWATTVGSRSVTIAVLDTGVDAAHEDLAGAVVAGRDFVDDAGATSDRNGHGTLTAGVAAARTDNARGMAGVCWTCRVLAVRVLDENGHGTAAAVAAGIRYAADAGAHVITLSLGTAQPSSTLELAIDYAVARGSLPIASAGNAGTTGLIYPAAYATVLGVAASDEHDQRYSWSSHGGWVSLAAPGCNVATHPGPEPYGWFCGTSAAAPVVAGVAGLAFAADPAATSADVRAALQASARPVGYVAHGRVDAAGTLSALLGDAPSVHVERFAGSDRYDTAARASAGTFPAGVRRVYVATGEAFPDALAAGPAAAAGGGPVLLTASRALPPATERELKRLRPTEVAVVGGSSAVADTVLARIREVTGVRPVRIAGENRFATAAAVAREAFADRVGVVYVATGLAFADALSGTPAAAVDGAPLLLTLPDRLPAATLDALGGLRPDAIVVLGGKAAVDATVESALARIAPVTRIAGADRYDTAARVAARAYPAQASVAALATGANFPDALAGGPVAAHLGGPLLLVHRDALPDGAQAALRNAAPPRVLALGAAGVIADDTLAAAASAAALGH